MPNFYTTDSNGTGTFILATAVVNTGTVTIPYPTGTTQNSYNTGLNVPSRSYVILNGNDKYTVAAGRVSFTFNSGDITVTNSSGVTWPAGTSLLVNLDIQDGNEVEVLTLPVFAMAGIANGDVVTEIRPGIAGTIEHWEWVQGVPVTTASRAATLNLEIDTTNVTGGTIALTSAACTPLGRVIPGSAITGANVLTRESRLSVEASSVTAFAEGSGYLLIRIRKA